MSQVSRPAGAAAYNNRESASTRNPHASSKPVDPKRLAKLKFEDRILAQWNAAYGNPISDEAKAQFCIIACERTFMLADVRLWQAHHRHNQGQNKSIVHLEFFFDGSPDELGGREDCFIKAFESMVEKQLQEVRATEFRKRLAARRRGAEGVQRRCRGGGCVQKDESVEGGSSDSTALDSDEDWKEYLKRPVPATELRIESIREAGCMIRFLVCQTSISASAAEVLGQIAFQEHFPIDGIQQEPSKSTKPLPRWVYGLACFTASFTVIVVYAWWRVFQTVAFRGGEISVEGGEVASLP